MGGGGKLHRDNKVNKKRSVHVKLHFKVQENRVETGYTYTYLYYIIYIFIMNYIKYDFRIYSKENISNPCGSG